ncbi:MAG: PQQ-binding-like beta-propeller repeat protein [Candidatus Eisenbacteria bacterium]|nr:PQQ-binding-like beta-propeller repeat protein [Candidatus Eisenbacteria bacterium]
MSINLIGRSSLRRALSLLVATLLVPIAASRARSQAVDTTLWVTNGWVNTVLRSGNTLYIGGCFSRVGPHTGSGAVLERGSGALVGSFPRVNGSVFSSAPDGKGGWYIGGSFWAVGGLARARLAHILADGRVADWNPGPDSEVWAIAVHGRTVYVGGTFTAIAGRPQRYLAAMDAVTGALTAWNPRPDRHVTALAVRGKTVYAGGDFGAIGGQPRTRIAALDAVTGAATAWNPGANDLVWGLVVRDTTVYAAGEFTAIGGRERRGVAALSASGFATDWDAHADDGVHALALHGNTLFAGGRFTRIGGAPRLGLAALDVATGIATHWDPGAFPSTRGLAVRGGTVYAAGGQAVVALDAATGSLVWRREAEAYVMTLVVEDRRVYVGGTFSMLGVQQRRYLAALDATTGEATPWDPEPSGGVNALLMVGNTLYVGGEFWSIGGKQLQAVAAVDATTGAVYGWDAHLVDGWVNALAVRGSTVYVGGLFAGFGGQPRTSLAAFDATTGAVTQWAPVGSRVYSRVPPRYDGLAVHDSTVYVTGIFGELNGQPRNGLAAVDAVTGAVRSWNPQPAGPAICLVSRDEALYAGGYFWVGAFDHISGATLWRAPGDGVVNALTVVGNTAYAGGDFQHLGGEARLRLAALDAATGAVASWAPGVAGGEVRALGAHDGVLYAGGLFSAVAGVPRPYLAALDIGSTEVPRRRKAAPLAAEPAINRVPALVSIAPNPASNGAVIRFTLPAAGPVTLAVFDLQGRRAATPIDRSVQPPGVHEVSVRTEGWRPGVYLCRLEAAGRVATRKLMVVR